MIDLGAGGTVGVTEPILSPGTSRQYLVTSLMEEAITSSQLEGAATTRETAVAMLRASRKPRDLGERMIVNNYLTMRHVQERKAEPLTSAMVLDIHRLVTDATLDDPGAAGRIRRPDEDRVVADDYGNVLHTPPPAEQLEERIKAMCDFANAATADEPLHPVIRAIILHFWLAYDHPFVDGNGRTARALFYWSMLNSGYWVFEYVSISQILRAAQVGYGRSFLHVETDGNDLTYFVVDQLAVIRRAIEGLHRHIAKKTSEHRDAVKHLRVLDLFNHRQVALLLRELKSPGESYTIRGHEHAHKVVHATARADLLKLEAVGLLVERTAGRQRVFRAPPDLADRLRRLDEEGADGDGRPSTKSARKAPIPRVRPPRPSR